MTHPTARTGFDDPFDGEDAMAVLRAATEAVTPPEGTVVPLRFLEDLREGVERMIADEMAEQADTDNDEVARDHARLAAFVLGGVLELANQTIGRALGSS